MRYVLAWAAAFVAAMLGSASLLTTLITPAPIDASVVLDWELNERSTPTSFVGISVSAADRGSGVVLPPEPGQPSGATHSNAISGTSVLGAKILRFPDDISQSYHWNSAFGTSTMDTDRFAFLTTQAGVPSMMLTVNMLEGSSDEATNWVAYTNSAAGTQFGSLRSSRGNPEPFNVQYWMLGEEILTRPDKYPSAVAYLEAALANASAMKAVSPSISVGLWIAPGDSAEEGDWNDALMENLRLQDPGQALVPLAPLIDFIGVAVDVDVPDRPATDGTLFASLYGFAAERARTVLEQAERTNQLLRHPLPIAVYRYQLHFAEDGWNQDKGDSMGATVAITGMLSEFIRHETLFTAIYKGLNADSYSAVLKVPSRYNLPAARQFELNAVGEVIVSFGQYLSGMSLQPEITGVGATINDAARAFYRAPALGNIEAQDRIPIVSIGACVDEGDRQMIIWVASRAQEETVNLNLRFENMGTTVLGRTDAEGRVRAVVQLVYGPTLGSDRYASFETIVSNGQELALPFSSPEQGVFEVQLSVKPHSVSTVVFVLE